MVKRLKITLLQEGGVKNSSICFHKQKFSKVITEDIKTGCETFHLLLFSLIILKNLQNPKPWSVQDGEYQEVKDVTYYRGLCSAWSPALQSIHPQYLVISGLFPHTTQNVLELSFYIRISSTIYLFIFFILQTFSFT